MSVGPSVQSSIFQAITLFVSVRDDISNDLKVMKLGIQSVFKCCFLFSVTDTEAVSNKHSSEK